MIRTDIDLDRTGKQQGFLRVPYSHNLAGWANIMIPITVIARGQGPTVLVLGGNHGDEYQGQVAIMKLARALSEDSVHGRLILIPALNFPAAQAASRLSPIDGMNLNRAFPGDAEGSVTSQIALGRLFYRTFHYKEIRQDGVNACKGKPGWRTMQSPRSIRGTTLRSRIAFDLGRSRIRLADGSLTRAARLMSLAVWAS